MKNANEQRLMILLSRITFSDSDIEEIEGLSEAELDWNYILLLAIKNKILALLWVNLDQLGLIKVIPRKIRQVMKLFSQGIQNRTEEYLRLVDELQLALQKIIYHTHF